MEIETVQKPDGSYMYRFNGTEYTTMSQAQSAKDAYSLKQEGIVKQNHGHGSVLYHYNGKGYKTVEEARKAKAHDDELKANPPPVEPMEIRKINHGHGSILYHYNGKGYKTYEQAQKAKEQREGKPSQEESAPAEPSKVEQPQAEAPKSTGSNLGGRTTEEWVAWMRGQGKTDEEIMDAYEKEGYSRNGELFKKALSKYPEKKVDEPEDDGKGEDDEKDKNKDKEPVTPPEIKEFSDSLNTFVIDAYRSGTFGDPSTWKAKRNAGFFILDKLATGLVNASLVARGLTPSQKSAWSNVIDKQTEWLGNDTVADYLSKTSQDKKNAFALMGKLGTNKENLGSVQSGAADRIVEKETLEISGLKQEQKATAQQNLSALMARKAELQQLYSSISADMGWNEYVMAMNAMVGTAKGLSTVGVTKGYNTSSTKGFSDTLNVSAKTGGIPAMFVDGGVDNTSTWNNSSTTNTNLGNNLTQDALALSQFDSAKAYAGASREAKRKANEELKKNIQKQIDIIDKCISSWGKDLGVDTSTK